MASEVFFNRIPYAQRRGHDSFLPSSSSGATTHVHRSVGTTRSGGALTFPPLFLDPVDSHINDPASTNPNNPAQQPGSFVLGSTFYHHPSLTSLVSNHLSDASASTPSTSTAQTFLSSIFANREGGAHDEDSDTDEECGVSVPRPKITAECVSLNEDLVPASLDMLGDMLPADQHASYPFGNLFGPLGGSIPADSAIVGGSHHNHIGSTGGLGDAAATLGLDFGGGLDGFIALGQPSHGRRNPVTSSWNGFINKASRSKLVGSSASVELPESSTTHPETIKAAKKLEASPSVLFRTNTSTVLAPPTWPFRPLGPGNTSYAALLRPSSNVYGTAPASQAVAAALGGLPASSKIVKEVWSDLGLEEILPTKIGETSATRHLSHDQDDNDPEAEEAGVQGNKGKKRRRDEAELDAVFAKRVAMMEPDPLDLLGPVSREIRGQAARPWGTNVGSSKQSARPQRRHRSTYPNQSEDEAEEIEHDDPEQGYAQRDRVRYSFALPPTTFSWTESPDDEEHDEAHTGTLHVEPDGIGWSTAKRIFINEERDRVLPEVASRATGAGGGVEAYQVRGLRANQGLLPRPAWKWGDGPADEASEMGNTSLSFATDASRHIDHDDSQAGDQEQQASAEASDDRYLDEEDPESWQHGSEDEDAELHRALLLQYQNQAEQGSQAALYDEEDDVEAQDLPEEKEGFEYQQHPLDTEEEEGLAVEEDDDVDSFSDSDTA